MIISSVPTTNANKQNRIERTRTTSSGLTAGVRTRKKGLNFPCDEWKFIRLRFRRSFVRCSLFFPVVATLQSGILHSLLDPGEKGDCNYENYDAAPNNKHRTATVTSSWTSSGVDKQQNENTGLQTAYTTSQSSNASLSDVGDGEKYYYAWEDLWSSGHIDSARGCCDTSSHPRKKKDKHFKTLIIPLSSKSRIIRGRAQ